MFYDPALKATNLHFHWLHTPREAHCSPHIEHGLKLASTASQSCSVQIFRRSSAKTSSWLFLCLVVVMAHNRWRPSWYSSGPSSDESGLVIFKGPGRRNSWQWWVNIRCRKCFPDNPSSAGKCLKRRTWTVWLGWFQKSSNCTRNIRGTWKVGTTPPN